MAQIMVSGAEVVGLLQANGGLPEEVTVLEADGREFRLRVRTPLPLLTSVQLSVQFVGYESGRIILQFATNRLLDSFGAVIDEAVASLHLEDYGGRWEYPRVYVAVNPLLRRRAQGAEIEDIVFRDGCFHIRLAVCGPAETGAADRPPLRLPTDAAAPESQGG